MKKATEAIALGWATVRDALRPGLRFSDITALGRETLRKVGYGFEVAFAPHSVGLYHTDAAGLGDLVLEPGMILSVDCPVMQAGIGGGPSRGSDTDHAERWRAHPSGGGVDRPGLRGGQARALRRAAPRHAPAPRGAAGRHIRGSPPVIGRYEQLRDSSAAWR